MTEATQSSVSAQTPDICVILNTRSGKRRAAQEQLEGAFAKHPGRFTLHVLKSGRDIERATRDAVAAGYGMIVAAGGDGTISGIAPIVADAGLRFGALPFGTFNYFARSIGMPEEIEEAVDVIARGKEHRISRSEVNGEGFLNNASLGAYAAILQRRERVYRRWGRSRIAAYWSVISTLLRMRTSQPMVIEIDGEAHDLRTPLAFVAANPFQLEIFRLPGAEDVRAGKLALFLAPDRTGPALLAFAARLAIGGVEESRDFTLMTGRSIRIETERKRRLVARDGEKTRMESPFVFRTHPGALRVICPGPRSGSDE